jgi:hypothetical protein
MGKHSWQGKMVARSSRREVAILAKGGNSSAAKGKNLEVPGVQSPKQTI